MVNVTEEEIKKLEAEIEQQIGSLDSDKPAYGSPAAEIKDNIFKFFREILVNKEPWKVGNMTDTEIGKTKITCRGYLELASYADAEGLDVVGSYLKNKADIIAATSMGRKGFLAQLFVTQIKREQKLQTAQEPKKGLFGFSKPKEEENVQ